MKRILLVDQDREHANDLQGSLSRCGFRVSSAPTGAAAARILAADHPDIVVADIQLPDASGVDLLSRIDATEGIPIVLMGTSPDQAAEAILRGATDYVLKPNQDSTIRAVARLATEIEGKTWLPSPSKRSEQRPSTTLRHLKQSAIFVRGLRKWMGLPQDDFANVLGYKTRSISKWEQGASIAGHATRTLEIIDQMRGDLVRVMGWRGSQEWLNNPQTALAGKKPIESIWSRDFGNVLLAAVEVALAAGTSGTGRKTYRVTQEEAGPATDELDENYQAFLRDQPQLEAGFPGSIVAYANGRRVAIAQNSKDLISNLPPQYAQESLFIADIPETVIKMRRPMRVLQS
jgi:CheY-like chemotaxis protein